MANFTTKTIKEVYEDLISRYTILRNKYNDTTPLLEKASIKSIFYALSGAIGTLWRQFVWGYKQCFPQTCDLDALKLWGSLIGVYFKTGETANLEITLNDVMASYLSSGTIYKDLTSGMIYKTLSQVSSENSKIVATAVCTTSGPGGNLSVGTTLTIANPLDGIPQTATVTSVSIEGTNDEETETYRKRVLYGYRNKAQGGSPLDYYNWVMEVSGIVDVLVYVLTEGTVTIYPIKDGTGKNRTPNGTLTPNPFPSWVDGQFTELAGSGQLLQIANAIEGSATGVHDRRPCNAKVQLANVSYSGFTVEITGLEVETYNEQIKKALISLLDAKRPHLVVLGYSVNNAKINKQELSAACYDVLSGYSFTTFLLKNSSETSIEETTLGVGCLAYLDKLVINGLTYYDSSST